MNVDGTATVVTGATGGIGQAIARLLAQNGARLILAARREDRLSKLLSELPGSGHRMVAADLTLAEGRRDLVAACSGVDRGGISVLINAAGINELCLLSEQSTESVSAQLQINLLTPILVCRDLLPLLMHHSQARILNVGSTFGSIGFPGFSAYCASKFGLRGFTEALRRELSDTSVRVSYIAPRATRTGMNEGSIESMNKALKTVTDEPEVVASQVLKCLRGSSSRDRYLGWPEKLLVRLNAIVPRLIDAALRKQLPTIRRFARSSAT